MSTPRAVRVFAWLGMVLVFMFIAVSVDARGGRGGGGRGGGGRGGGGFGGSRSISRSGPASHGSYRTQRPSTRPSYQRPSTGQRPSAGTRPSTQPSRPSTQPSRPSTQPSRPGTQPARPEAQPSRPTTQPAERPSQRPGERPGERPGGGEDRPDRDDAREDWQQHRDDMQQDRQDYANNAREDWQEYAEWDEGGGYWIGGWYGPVVYHDDVDNWLVFLSGIAIGTALSSAAYHSMQTETKCTPTEVTVNQITYLKCGSNWYNRVMQGGTVSYVVVAAPPGF